MHTKEKIFFFTYFILFLFKVKLRSKCSVFTPLSLQPDPLRPGCTSSQTGCFINRKDFPFLTHTKRRSCHDLSLTLGCSLLTSRSGPKLYKEPSAKSNKHIIQNALAHCCLAGKVNEGQKNKILEVTI